jgi:hypothetical protein
MAHITAAVSEDLHARIRAYAEVYGVTQSSALAALVDAGLQAEATPSPMMSGSIAGVVSATAIEAQRARDPVTLDEASAVFMAHIRPEQAELIRVLGAETGFTPANYLLGYAKVAHERGETAAMYDERVRYDRDTAGPQTVVPDLDTTGTCEQCAAIFTPSRVKQRFCPDPDDGTVSCGRAWTLEHQIHPSRPVSRPGGFAPPRVQPPTPFAPDTVRELAVLKRQMAELMAKLEPAAP